MVLVSSPQLKTMPGSHGEKSTLDQGTPSSALAFDGGEAGYENCVDFAARPVPIFTRVISGREFHLSCARAGPCLAKLSCAPGRAGREGEHHAEKFRS